MAEAEEEVSASPAEQAEGPFLFLCCRCRMPLADSGDCVEKTESPESEDIMVKAVTENVEIDESRAVSSYELDAFSTVQILYCKGCSTSIGALYVATPVHLDYKRDLFILNTSALTCYFFDNPDKQRSNMNEKSVNLPNVAYMEAQLKKCRTVFGFCERAVTEMENKLSETSENP